jgi:secreted trypsin-like serine protease
MVHAIFNATSGQLCGGSLISPNYVITAGNWVGQ